MEDSVLWLSTWLATAPCWRQPHFLRGREGVKQAPSTGTEWAQTSVWSPHPSWKWLASWGVSRYFIRPGKRAEFAHGTGDHGKFLGRWKSLGVIWGLCPELLRTLTQVCFLTLQKHVQIVWGSEWTCSLVREMERNIDVSEKHQLVASCLCPDMRPNLHPRHVPWPGIEPTTFGSWDNIPTDWATPARDESFFSVLFFWGPNYVHINPLCPICLSFFFFLIVSLWALAPLNLFFGFNDLALGDT